MAEQRLARHQGDLAYALALAKRSHLALAARLVGDDGADQTRGDHEDAWGFVAGYEQVVTGLKGAVDNVPAEESKLFVG